jgi:PKD repeat protein
MTAKTTKRGWKVLPALIVVSIGLLVLAGCFYIGNILPVAIFTVSTTLGDSPLTVNFNASSSYDPDGTITAYAWDFGPAQTPATGVLASHTFTVVGVATAPAQVFTVVLTVTDNSGGTDTATRNITVNPKP